MALLNKLASLEDAHYAGSKLRSIDQPGLVWIAVLLCMILHFLSDDDDDDGVSFDDEDRMPIALIKKLDRGRDSVAGGDGQQTLRLPMRREMMIVIVMMSVFSSAGTLQLNNHRVIRCLNSATRLAMLTSYSDLLEKSKSKSF